MGPRPRPVRVIRHRHRLADLTNLVQRKIRVGNSGHEHNENSLHVRVDTWTRESILEHVAGVEDYQATFRAACERWLGHSHCRDADRRKARGDFPHYIESERLSHMEPEKLKQLRRLMDNSISLDAAWAELNDYRNRPTPKTVVETVMHAIR